MEQWKVISEGFRRTYSKELPAKRKFGEFVTEIEEEEQGSVKLYYREGLKKRWMLQEEFALGDDAEEEEEDEGEEEEEDEDEDENEDEDEDEDK
jgi:hypothetical protein